MKIVDNLDYMVGGLVEGLVVGNKNKKLTTFVVGFVFCCLVMPCIAWCCLVLFPSSYHGFVDNCY